MKRKGEGGLEEKEERQKNEGAHENTVMRLLSCCAHGSAVALTIDVAENSGRQETKLPAVPPHYESITEGWPAAAVDLITGGRPLALPEECEVPWRSHTHKLFAFCLFGNSI